jgi:hypothetical protein
MKTSFVPIKYGIIRYPDREIYHKRGEYIMSQGAFNFKYVKSENKSGMTSHAGLGIYFDLLERLDFVKIVKKEVSVSGSEQGWSDWQVILSTVLLNLSGGDSVEDISHLSADEGLCRLVSCFEKGLSSQERKELAKRWRKGRQRVLCNPQD